MDIVNGTVNLAAKSFDGWEMATLKVKSFTLMTRLLGNCTFTHDYII